MQVKFHVFLTKMLVTMITHSWQQIQNHVTWKLREHVTIRVLII